MVSNSDHSYTILITAGFRTEKQRDYLIWLGAAYLTSFVYTLYIEKKTYHGFLFVNTDVS